ncbi:hypothetical protein [Pseudomonas mandelii]|uniref:ORC-CDC6 family AAA ATPase n=1 Tax=Pseudomonas mandelii TaxID=75612 RepID=UPI00224ADAF8|nr:hypothetical protein [Pseudomonas mandelii]MCX2896390.1 hypothetical protein [Pseudomonas mandelii]
MDANLNPFDVIRAADYSDAQINDYWVDFEGEGLLSLIEPLAKTSKHILGGKGSGKTHLMRYCSYPAQKLRLPSGCIDDLIAQGYLGIFLRANILDTGRFSGKGQGEDKWGPLFNFYFELRLVEHLVQVLADLATLSPEINVSLNSISANAVDLFDIPPSDGFSTWDSVFQHIVSIRKRVDHAVNNCVFTKELAVNISISPGSLLFGLPKLVSTRIAALRNLRFIYLLDEVENLSVEQQKFINTLIRHRQDPCTFRLGARLYGIKTHANYGSDEENKDGSEFRALYLDQLIRARSRTDEYKRFAKELCAKRLIDGGILDSSSDLKKVIHRLPDFFATFNSDNFYAAQIDGIFNSSSSDDPAYFKKLIEQLSSRSDEQTALLNQKEINQIIKDLRVPGVPLLEKLNIFMFYQDWFRGKSIVQAAKEIHKGCVAYIDGAPAGNRHKRLYGHFSLDLLAQMYRDFKLSPTPMYSGFDAFVKMSAGVPRNLLVILRNVYKWSAFNGEKPFYDRQIPISTQCEAVSQSAGFFFDEDARPGVDVPSTQNAVERLAEYLREVRFSSKPVEVSPLAFSVDVSDLTEKAKQTLRLAENWSYIFKIVKGRPNANSQHIDDKYQLNPMLSPKWDLPVSVRGDVRLSKTLAEAIFGELSNDEFKVVLQEATASLKAPGFGKKRANSNAIEQQKLMLDFGGSNEV